jgi:hypothetical protein
MADSPFDRVTGLAGIPSISIPSFSPMEPVTQQEGVMAVGNPEQAFNQADILAGAAGETEDLGLRGSIRDNAREGTLQETLDKIQSDPANAIKELAIEKVQDPSFMMSAAGQGLKALGVKGGLGTLANFLGPLGLAFSLFNFFRGDDSTPVGPSPSTTPGFDGGSGFISPEDLQKVQERVTAPVTRQDLAPLSGEGIAGVDIGGLEESGVFDEEGIVN